MSKPRFDATALQTALGVGRPPARFDRAGRIRLLGEAAQALLRGELPEPEAALFLAGAVLAWLQQGGSLEREFLKVTKPKSHQTPARIWAELNAHQDERQDEVSADTLAPTEQESERRK